MIVFYNEQTGQIISCVEAKDPNTVPPKNAGTPLYLDDDTYADLWNNGSPLCGLYKIENNAPVALPPVPLATQVQEAAKVQVSIIQDACQTTISGQFRCKATGHTYASSVGGQVNFLSELPRFQYDPTLKSVSYDTLDAGWVDHTEQDIQNALVEGGRWKDAQYARMNELVDQVNQLASAPGTTVAEIQAIVFTEADYEGVSVSSSETTP